MELLQDIQRILDKDEKVIKVLKPNKKRFLFWGLLITCLGILIFSAIFLTIGILGKTGVIEFTDEETGNPDEVAPIMFIIIGSVALVVLLITALFRVIRYKRLFYVITNKRLIIRSGVIGVDFKSLEYKLIGLVDVKVGVIDKLVRPNPGTLMFGSASAPIVHGNGNVPAFFFLNIDDPYGVYKLIKEVMSGEYQQEEKKEEKSKENA
ncbi:MAG: PH domain-containing protein [Bacilli bacterium]|nr:PH domain-containing protein [Bacilli bacterium]